MSSNKKNDKKNIKKLQLPRVLTVFMLLALLIIGLVSTTFASFVADNSTPDDGSLVARVQTAVSANREKKDLASLGADTYYLAGTMNGWNTTSTPMTQGTDTNGQTFYYSGYYSNQEQFKVVKNGSTWLGHEKNSSSVYPNSLSMYQYGNSGNCWPGSGGYYVVYNPTQDKISCVTVLPLKVEEVVFEAGDVVYFDIRNNTEWLTADSSSKMYIQFNNSTTGSTSASDRAQLTQIGTYLYKYEFTADCKSSIRFWRGNESSMWNYSNSLSSADGNGVYIASGGWSGSGTVATFSLTSIDTPSLTVSPATINLGESTTLSCSTVNPTINYKIGSTSYTTTAVSGDIKYTFKNGTTALNTASTTASYTWKPTAAGTYSTYVTITSTSTGLTATSTAKTLTVNKGYTYTATNGTGGTVSATPASPAETVTVTATPNTGYEFDAWTLTGGVTKDSTSNSNGVETGKFTLTADGANIHATFKKITGTVTLNNEGATTPGTSSVNVTYGEAMPNISVPAKTGYTFNGYYTTKSGGIKYYNADGTSAHLWDNTSVKALYAQYTLDEYDIIYKDGSTTLEGLTPTTYDYETTATLPTNVTKVGYTFVGWYKNSSFTGSAVTQILKNTTTGNQTFYAKWLKTDYDLTIKKASGSATSAGITVKANGTTLSEKTAGSGVYSVPHLSDVEISIKQATNTFFKTVTLDGTTDKSNLNSTYTKSLTDVTTAHTVEYNLVAYKSFTLNYTKTDDYIDSIKDTLVYRVGTSTSEAVSLGESVACSYGVSTKVYVTAPQGYYARIVDKNGNYLAWSSVTYTNSTGNNPLTTATFNVTVTTADVNYSVEYYKNPTIKVVQPKYGSIYITSGSGTSTKYYMNGESVFINTTLTVHTMIDNDKNVVIDGNRKTEFNSCTISSVKYTPEGGSAVSLKNQETDTFKITANTTVTAEITMNALYAFDEKTEKTEYGKRRIFFTDNADWDKDSKDTVSVHYSDVEEDVDAENFDVTANSIVMTYKYDNEATQGVYYADIPFSAKYVIFYNNVKTEDDKYEKTKVGTISDEYNAFWNDGGTLQPWHCEYSDFIATDRATTAQQGIVPINNTITFEYSCNYGDDTLSAEVVSGNAANVEFNSGYLNITPTADDYDYSLVKVTSASSTTVKYYLVKLSKITAVVNKMQKIFPEINSVGLSGSFSSFSVLTSLQYYVSLTNFNDASYVKLGDINIDADKLSCDFDVAVSAGTNGEKFSGVRFFKITAKDSTNATLDVVHKTAFGTDSTSSTGRSVYLLNTTGVSMSKYNVRACFESSEGKSWVTMQQLEGTDYYRASVPDGYEYTVSFYLTHKDRYANIKSTEEGFNYICYFYNEDIRIPNDINVNPVYQIKEFNSSDRTMKLVLKE